MASRTGALIWVSESGLSDKARAVIAEVRRADDWGLRAKDFPFPQLTAAETSPEAAAEAEIKLTLTVLKYARYARGGRISDPSRISKLLDHTPPVHPPALVLTDLAATDAADAYLRALHPKHPQFERLRQLLLKLRGSKAKGGSGVGSRTDAKEGAIAYGAKLQSVVPQLQRANSWDPDVNIESARADLNGRPTVEDENVDAAIDRIIINMERWRWVPADMGEFYVWDNVPEFLTRIMKSGQAIHTDEIIVGQPSWPTPIFSADMKTIVFRPSWGVPDGIKTKELAPLLRKSSGGGLFGIFGGGYSAQAVLDAHDLRAYVGGRQIDANSVDWANVDIRRYSFQQPPGPKNVLGDVKFMFPNVARRLHARYAGAELVQQVVPCAQPWVHARARAAPPGRGSSRRGQGLVGRESAKHVRQRRRGRARQAHPGAHHLFHGARRRQRQAADVRRFLWSRRPRRRRYFWSESSFRNASIR